MLPQPRKLLRNISTKNKSLRDILSSNSSTIEILSVAIHEGGIHNTQIILLLQNGIRRVHFYNRLNLATILADVVITSVTIPDIITELNILGYDFTGDDLELVDDYLVAKETSLGYYGDSGIRAIPAPSFEYATSKIYPIEEVIQLSTDFSLDEPVIRFNNFTDGLEKIESLFDLDDVIISREVRYLLTNTDVEQLQASFSLDDVIVYDLLKRQSVEPEGLNCSFSLDDVIVAHSLIRNTMPMELMSCSFSLDDVILEDK